MTMAERFRLCPPGRSRSACGTTAGRPDRIRRDPEGDRPRSRDYTEVGNGAIDFQAIWPDAALSGLKHFFVEQGGNFTHDPFRSVSDSAEYVKRVLLKWTPAWPACRLERTGTCLYSAGGRRRPPPVPSAGVMKQATLRRTRGIALDMGTESTRLFAPGARLSQTPTRDPLTGRPVVVRGLVVDAEGAARLAARLIARRRTASRVVAACPLHVAAARRRLAKALRLAGVQKVEFVGSMVAAAAGAGVDVTSPYAEMVVDVGAGLTEVAVFRNAAVLAGGTIPLGTRDLRLDERDASADRSPHALARQVFRMWKDLPVDAQVEVIENGLVLTGGGAAVPQVVAAMEAQTRLTVRAAPDPAQAVIRGLARLALGAP